MTEMRREKGERVQRGDRTEKSQGWKRACALDTPRKAAGQ